MIFDEVLHLNIFNKVNFKSDNFNEEIVAISFDHLCGFQESDFLQSEQLPFTDNFQEQKKTKEVCHAIRMTFGIGNANLSQFSALNHFHARL